VPTLEGCRTIQLEVREWLAKDIHGRSDKHRHALAVLGKHRIIFSVIGADGARGPDRVAAIPWVDPGDPTFRNIKPLKEFHLSSERASRVFDPGIQFAGSLLCASGPDGPELAWSWHITRASLRATLGVAVLSIGQAGLASRVGVCARHGCATYYIDRESRGVPRKYCKSSKCGKELNRARVAKCRINAKPKKTRSKK
jgi:hypothetical protein